MTIQCVSVETNSRFFGNPLAEQHKLRHRAIIMRQHWEIPEINGMEYDQYDNPATVYFVWSDSSGVARGVARLYPTDRPYMIEDHFDYMVDGELPKDSKILEGSRFCIDNTLPREERALIAQELVLSYLEYALSMKAKSIVGIMYPAYWRNLFIKNGWKVEWLGEIHKTPDGKKSRAGNLPVSQQVLQNVRDVTGLHVPVLDFGISDVRRQNQAA